MEKITLKGYYDSLPAESPQRKFKKEVMKRCMISTGTFYNWIAGRWPVPEKAKEPIADIAGVPADELFSNS